jgi:LytS/YehU family sensor histidine kinase
LLAAALGLGDLYVPFTPSRFFSMFVNACLTYIDLVLVGHAIHFARAGREEALRRSRLETRLAEAQLQVLRLQLHPHFLFNTLNTISSLMQVDVERADRLLTRLADLLRASLQAGAGQLTSVREEMALLRLYADILQERFAGRVSIDWHIADEVLDAAIPVMLLQPLLENAFRHGVERSLAPVAVEISARRSGDALEVVVRNDGELRETPGDGIGLRNCRERLAVLYGEAASLTLAADGSAVVARVSLPWQVYAA